MDKDRQIALGWARKHYEQASDAEKGHWEFIFPELKESEDERIRKNILALVKKHAVNHERCQMEAYLEKQKEQPKEELGKYLEEENLAYRLNWVMQDYIKAGKDDEEKEHRLKCYNLFWDALEDAEFFEQKEQKPYTYDESKQAAEDCYNDEFSTGEYCHEQSFLWGFEEGVEWCEHHKNPCKEQKPAECIEDSVKFEEGFRAGRESGLCDGQKYVLDNLDSYGLCKPAERSEKDKEIVGNLRSILNAYAFEHSGLDVNGDYIEQDYIDADNWLKSLRERVNIQPKQEWSEEDEKMMNRVFEAYDALRLYIKDNEIFSEDDKNYQIKMLGGEVSWLRNLLKSLRPQPKARVERRG